MEPAMDGLDELYMEIILDHYRDPRNRGELAPPAHMAEGFNPMCGDEIKVFLDIENNLIKEIRIGGQGCSISQASASMMTTLIEGKSIEEVHHISKAFKSMMAIHEEGEEGGGSHGPGGQGGAAPGEEGAKEKPEKNITRDMVTDTLNDQHA